MVGGETGRVIRGTFLCQGRPRVSSAAKQRQLSAAVRTCGDTVSATNGACSVASVLLSRAVMTDFNTLKLAIRL
jgi:hypothetical protein